MIEDKELSDLFQVESEEHISKIEDGLLVIEKNPDDLETMHVIFREAHSLKGAARMLGVSDVETLSHLIEELLGKASKGEYKITSSQIDRIYYTIDVIKNLVEEAITGEKTNADVLETLDVLNGIVPIPRKKKPQKRFSQGGDLVEEDPGSSIHIREIPPSEIKTPEPKIQLPKKQTPIISDPEKVKIDTMRVDSTKLDTLMVQTGELIVTKLRIGRRLKEVEEIRNHFEEFIKINQDARRVLKILETETNPKVRSIYNQLDSIFKQYKERSEKVDNSLEILQKRAANDSTKLDLISGKLEDGIQKIRMLPLSSVFNLFNRTVRDLSRNSEKEIQLIIEGGDIAVDKQIIEDMKDPLMHLIRNAIDHGLETPEERKKANKPPLATLKLSGKAQNNTILIEIEDDGRGLNIDNIKSKAIEKNLYSEDEISNMDERSIYQIIFMHGFSTRSEVSEISGRGVGMDVVKTFIDNLKGHIDIDSEFGKGTTFTLRLPIRFSTTHVLIIEVESKIYGIPIDYVVLSKIISLEEIYTLEGKNTVTIEKEPIPVHFLKDQLDLQSGFKHSLMSSLSCITISDGSKKIGLIVDKILDKQEVIMKPLGGYLKKVRNVSGGTILESGEVCIILNPKDLLHYNPGLNKDLTSEKSNIAESNQEIHLPILIAEDSITIRTQIQRILETSGFLIDTAIDGQEAYEKLSQKSYSLLITDVEMPNINGFQLTKKIRSTDKIKELPVIILTTLGNTENIQAGMEAGANAYLVKSRFDQMELIQTIKRFI